ncbi:hypothetical protein ES708_15981 [subsurface metagenome]
MAKVISPLFSFGASGQLAKSIVFFPWKGLNVVRQWVCPANPKSSAQVTHRGYLTAAVQAIHDAMVEAVEPLNVLDKAAYATWASLSATPRTWFNEACRQWIDQSVLGKTPAMYRGGTVVPTTTQLVFTVFSDAIDTAMITAGTFFYGTTKTTLLESQAAVVTVLDHEAVGTLTGLTNGTRYWAQFRPSADPDWVGSDGPIYSGVPAA